MKKHSTHIIDKEAVKVFKNALPEEHWTVYDLQPDYGKDHKVELVEGGDHTGLTFWVQVKGQRKVKRTADGSVSFKLESKDLDYLIKLQAPVFLVVVDVTNCVGYWAFLQEYERTRLRNVAWNGHKSIQVRLTASNTLSNLKSLRRAVREAARYMTGLYFHADLGAEKRRLEAIDPRFKVEITAGTGGRHYQFHSDEVVPVEFSYTDGSDGPGKIEEMLDRGLPIVVKNGEIQVSGSPLFEFFHQMAGDEELRLEANVTVDGSGNLLRMNGAGGVIARIDAIPCKIICGRREARIEASLPFGLLTLKVTIPYEPAGRRPMSMPIDLSAWQGRRLIDLPFFDQLAGVFVGLEAGDWLAFECFAPGQRVLSGTMNFEEENPYRGVSFLIETLRKARAVAALRSVVPQLAEGYESTESLAEIRELHEILSGEGQKRRTPSARVRVTVDRSGLEKFLADVQDLSSPGTLTLNGDGTFPFLGEAIHIKALERVVTNMRLVDSRRSLMDQLERSHRKKRFCLVWEATEETETIMRERRADDTGRPVGVGRAG